MLPLFREYNIHHHRFPEHLRVSLVMAMVAPACALFFFQFVGWWNPWLWGCCGVGLSLALALYSVYLMHLNPRGLSRLGKALVARSAEWFPFYFVVIQSSIASLIVLFLWFSLSSLLIKVPVYVHAILILLALLIPVRRFVWARMAMDVKETFHPANEAFRAIWHILATVFITRVIIAATISDLKDTSPETVAWQIILWVPAVLYCAFVLFMAIDHLFPRSAKPRSEPTDIQTEEPMDKF